MIKESLDKVFKEYMCASKSNVDRQTIDKVIPKCQFAGTTKSIMTDGTDKMAYGTDGKPIVHSGITGGGLTIYF